MLTLTYARTPGESSRDLFLRARDDQHVALFMRRLSRRTGTDYSGRWIRKLEFQADGTVHWHLLIVGERFIPHDVVDDAWGFGHVWISRPKGGAVAYICKYVAKGGEFPEWVLGQRARGIRVVGASPGFWCTNTPTPKSTLQVGTRVVGVFIPLGESLARQRERCLVYVSGKYRRVKCSPQFVLMAAAEAGISVEPLGGWRVVFGRKASAFLALIDRCAKGLEDRPGRPAKRAGRALHSIHTRDRDAGGSVVVGVTRWAQESDHA